MSFCPIQPIEVTDLQPAAPTNAEPRYERVDPNILFVDHSYQRRIGERGARQIRRIVENFCWTKFKPPICAYAEHSGSRVLMVLDGQHTAIAAASNPNVREIPVMIVDAPDTSSQAAAFVGQNTERLGITPLQLHQAAVVSGDPEAQTVELVCARAGVTLVRTTPGNGRYEARQTIAVTALRGLIDRRSALGARKILEVLANADLAPITAQHIKAAELLMTGEEYAHRFDPADLTVAIGESFLTAEDEAKAKAHGFRLPVWRMLAMIWFRKTKKRRVAFHRVA